jgi:hypothetical protein
MEFSHHDSVTFYKKFEEECNKRVHVQTNCRTFTMAFGKMLGAHLDRVMIHKRLLAEWLNSYEITSKDEIAAISIRIVDYQEKLDLYDETFYWIHKKQEENLMQLKMVRKSFEELFAVFAQEVKGLQEYKINRLEKDLLELKQLFI